MAAEEPSPPFLVMGDIVQDYKMVDLEEEGWKKVDCERREAYGCGEDGQRIVKGLDLFVRVGHGDYQHLRPSMTIRATPDVLSHIGWKIDEDMAEIYGRKISISASILDVAGDVIVLCVYFHARHDYADFESYYLVYDSTAAALFLLPLEPDDCRSICSSMCLCPLKVKVGEDKYSLVLMAKQVVPSPPFKDLTQGVLLTWSPPPAPPSPGDSTSAWTIKKVRARENADRFRASEVFLWKGNAVWGDLAQDILYCDCSDLIDDGPGLVDVKCKMLPPECRDTNYAVPKHVYRTMGCVGDSIWFVIIDITYTHPPNCIFSNKLIEPEGQATVKVWTLDDLSEKEEWKPHREFKMQDIWEMDDFKEKRLPPSLPKYPMLRQQDNGVLYMMTPDFSSDEHAYLVGIDLSSDVMRLVVHRRMAIPWMDRFVFLDPDFFSRHRMAV